MRKIHYIITAVLFLVLCNVMPVLASNTAIIHLKEAPAPYKKLFSIIRDVMINYKKNMEKQGINNCALEIDSVNGAIETNWHPVHKGEQTRKIQVYVWGNLYRVDVWHRPKLRLSNKARKDYMSRLTEMQLQQEIEVLINSQ